MIDIIENQEAEKDAKKDAELNKGRNRVHYDFSVCQIMKETRGGRHKITQKNSLNLKSLKKDGSGKSS